MDAQTENRYRLNIDQIRAFLPHRSPFLLVDRVLEIHPSAEPNRMKFDSETVGTRVVAIKNITYNEPFFQGHFPTLSLYPGVLIVETMAQVASFATYPYLEKELERVAKEFQCILVGVNDARFRRPVVPGDTLRVEATVTKCRGKLFAFQCVATVDGQKVAEAEILANLMMKNEVL